jgi:hypothetical protein
MSRRRGITLIVTGIYRQNYSINNSVSKNVTSQYNLSFLNPIVIPFIIPLVYIEKCFPSAYLWMYFTVRLILLVMSSIKVTRHHNVWFFFFSFLILPLQFSWYISREFFYRYLPMDTGLENYISKGHRNILTEKFSLFFRLYLLIL